jgi:glucosylceramidase
MKAGLLEWMITRWQDGKAERSSGSSSTTAEIQPQEKQVLNLYPEVRFQEFQGFGAAFTESAGSVLNRLPAAQADRLVADCYGEDGLGYTWARVPIDSCDFSLSTYSACEPGPEGPRVNLASFREHEQTYIIPWLQKARDLVSRSGTAQRPSQQQSQRQSQRPRQLKLCMVPWSPPAHMKTNGSRKGGGTLLPEFRQDWARYLCRYVQAYEASGLPVAFLGTQNEPNAVQTWDSCLYSPAQERLFLEQFLSPQLTLHGLSHVRLSAWDHNREGLFDRISEVCAGAPPGLVSAAAFHWYSGDHFQALDLVHRAFPELLLIFTEGCIEYKHNAPDSQLAHAQRYGHNIIGDLNHGCHAWLDWNLTLDSRGGPNHVGNYCDAPIMCDLATGTCEKRLSYYYLEHFSRYIVPGSRRIGQSCYTDAVETTSWLQPDGTIVVVAMNAGTEDVPVVLRCEGRLAELVVPASGIVSLRSISPTLFSKVAP